MRVVTILRDMMLHSVRLTDDYITEILHSNFISEHAKKIRRDQTWMQYVNQCMLMILIH